MKLNTTDCVDYLFMASGVAISVQDIQAILSIIILCVDGIWLLIKASIKIYHAIKTKNINEITASFEELSTDVTNLKEKVKDVNK